MTHIQIALAAFLGIAAVVLQIQLYQKDQKESTKALSE